MELESTNSGPTAKLPLLKLVIENGDSWVLVPHTSHENGITVTKMSTPVTAEEKTNKKNDVKARESLDSIFNRLQKIVSRLAILGVIINQEDLNLKFLSSLPPEWNTQNKTVGTSSGSQNMAFMTAPSSSSTNDANTACPQVSAASPSVNAASANECGVLQLHKLGYFARECRAPRSKEGQFRNQDNTRKQGNNKDTSSKAMLAIDGVGFDWSDMAEEQVQTNMALMAFSDSEGKPQHDDKGFVDSGCSRHMTGKFDAKGMKVHVVSNDSGKDVDNGEPKTANDAQKQVEDGPNNENVEQERFADDSSTKDVNAAGQHINTARPMLITGSLKLLNQQALLKLYLIHLGWKQCRKNFCNSNFNKFGYWWISLMERRPLEQNGSSETRKNKRGIVIRTQQDDMILAQQTRSYVHSASTPVDLEKPLVKDGDADDVDVHLYRSMIGSLMYLTASRPDIMFATVNRVRQLQALVDKKRVIVTESSIRRDLHLDDAEGTNCLPTATIFEELARMRYEKPSQKLTFYKAFFSPQWKYFIHTITQCLSAKSTTWNEFSSSMASLIICLATNQKFNLSKYIFDTMVKHLDGGVKFLMYPCFLQVFINQQLGDMSTHKKIFVNPFHTKKVFANMKRAGKGFSGRITPLFDTMMVQVSKEVGADSGHPTDSTQVPILDHPSTSSKPKKNQTSKKTQRHKAEVPQDETEHEESVPIPSNDPQPSGEDSMQLTDLMVLCTKLQTQVLDLEKAKDAQAKEIDALKKRIQRLERKKMSRPTGLKRLKKVGMSRRLESSEDQESLVALEDASKHGRSIADIDADIEVTLVDETQKRQDDELMFDTRDLDTDEMPVEAKVNEKDEQSTKPDDSTANEAVTTASVKDSAAP
ncbi:hypothetical protein Tco_0882238 [Tanacetum coccineum]